MTATFREMIGVLIDFALNAISKKNYEQSLKLLEQAYDIAMFVGYNELALKIKSIVYSEVKMIEKEKGEELDKAKENLQTYSI